MMRVISLKHLSSTVLSLLLELALMSIAQSAHHVRSDTWIRQHSFEGFLPVDTVGTLPVFARTKAQCALQCLHEDLCEAFFYHTHYRLCWIRTTQACLSDPAEFRPGVRYFVKASKVAGPCIKDSTTLSVASACTCFTMHVTEPLSWSSARDACLQGNEALAVLDSYEKALSLPNIFFYADSWLPTDKAYYVDAKRVDNTTVFQWPSGEVVLDLIWSAGEPDVSNADNTVMAFYVNSSGAAAVDGLTPRYYVCQRPYPYIYEG